MAICLADLGGRRLNPFAPAVGIVVLTALYGILRGRAHVGEVTAAPDCAAVGADPCKPGASRAPTPGGQSRAIAESGMVAPAPTLTADAACHDVGYLCADLEHSDRIRIQHWKDFEGPIVVYVPRPDFEDAGIATRLQQAAAVGLREWNRTPFEILTDLQGDRASLFTVHWTRALGGSQIGVTHTRWSTQTGLRVASIELATRNPFDPNRLIDPEQVRLAAAHEMGHALGLPHSDSPRDVMYPTNTATSLTARDYRTMESLYHLADGVEIVR
jgi:Matrixin